MDVQSQTSKTWSLYSLMNVLYQFVASLGGKTVQAMLYTNNPVLGPGSSMSSLTEVTVGGYARQTITVWNGPYFDAFSNAFVVAPLVIFAGNGTTTSQSATGAAITEFNGGSTATFTSTYAGGTLTNLTVATGGTLYDGPPLLTFTGGGMTVPPTYTMTIVGGIITSVTLLTGGVFTSNPTITASAPCNLIEAGPFAAPAPIGAINEPIPFVPQLSVPPTTN